MTCRVCVRLCPARDWHLVQGGPRIVPNVPWDRLQLLHDPVGWMTCLIVTYNIMESPVLFITRMQLPAFGAHLSGRSSGVIIMRRRRILYCGPITFAVTIRKEIFRTGYKSSSNWASSRMDVCCSKRSGLLRDNRQVSHEPQEEISPAF